MKFIYPIRLVNAEANKPAEFWLYHGTGKYDEENNHIYKWINIGSATLGNGKEVKFTVEGNDVTLSFTKDCGGTECKAGQYAHTTWSTTPDGDPICFNVTKTCPEWEYFGL